MKLFKIDITYDIYTGNFRLYRVPPNIIPKFKKTDFSTGYLPITYKLRTIYTIPTSVAETQATAAAAQEIADAKAATLQAIQQQATGPTAQQIADAQTAQAEAADAKALADATAALLAQQLAAGETYYGTCKNRSTVQGTYTNYNDAQIALTQECRNLGSSLNGMIYN